MTKTAVAYYRTSSATNVGADKDSLKRQKEAVLEYATAHNIQIVKEFYDASVSGADPVHQREGFAELLTYVAGNGARTILVENASRFARDLTVQLTGHSMLKQLGYELVPADAPDYFLDETPTAVMVRQILGAVSEFEKAQLVSKLKVARERKKAETGKCEGRKSYQELNPHLVKEARRLRRASPLSGKRRSYDRVSKELFSLGFMTAKGNQFSASQVKRLVAT
jgi:DNA invertase Pin-like site-specific DNA recombinase